MKWPKWLTPEARRWLALSLAIHLITAWNSVGHHSADEYFQILEYANFKLGGTPLVDMPVEFLEKMRSWFQPALYVAFIHVFKFFHIQSPHIWARSFRIFAGFLGWLSGVGLVSCLPLWFKNERAQRFALRAVALLWCLPVLHVRPSSESLGGSCFLLALTCFERTRAERKVAPVWAALLSGVLLEISFEGRFQMGLMFVGLLAWWIFVGKVSWKSLTWIALGFLGCFALARGIDRWGYGDWSLSPWNYVRYNLVRGEVNRYGRTPWWDLYRMAITESWPVLGILLALLIPVSWLLRPLNILTWSQVPFFFIHEWIPHKELRFFFPIVLAAPISLAFVYERLRGNWARYAGWVLVPLNCIALLVFCFLPLARNVQFQEGLYNNLPTDQPVTLFIHERDPFENLGTHTHFYRPTNLTLHKLENWAELQAAVERGPVWFFDTRLNFPSEAIAAEPKLEQECQAVYRTLPSWVENVNFGNWLIRVNTWTLFRCQRDGS